MLLQAVASHAQRASDEQHPLPLIPRSGLIAYFDLKRGTKRMSSALLVFLRLREKQRAMLMMMAMVMVMGRVLDDESLQRKRRRREKRDGEDGKHGDKTQNVASHALSLSAFHALLSETETWPSGCVFARILCAALARLPLSSSINDEACVKSCFPRT